MLTRGQLIPLAIEKPAAGGRMIARLDGQVVLVASGIPGEQVTAMVERVSRGVTYAQTVVIERPSPDRREGVADPLCGGCLYAHISYARQLDLKAAVIVDTFRRIAHLELPTPVQIASSPEVGYRMRARLHVRGQRVGYFREGTHEICDPRQTGQLLAATCDVIEQIGTVLQSLGVQAVTAIELAENMNASDRVIQLDVAAPIEPRIVERIASIDGLSGVVSQSTTHGSAYVTDHFPIGQAAVGLRRHVRAFFQGNRYLLSDLVAHVAGHVPEDSDVLDLYAGVGLFALSAAVARGARVTAIEGDRFAAADLLENAGPLGGAVTPVHQTVEAYTAASRTKTDCVIVDPPRTGMSRDALDGVVGLKSPRLIYVSCDVATLARDARRLVDAGYTMSGIEAFDLFPNTPHVETVVVFQSASI